MGGAGRALGWAGLQVGSRSASSAPRSLAECDGVARLQANERRDYWDFNADRIQWAPSRSQSRSQFSLCLR